MAQGSKQNTQATSLLEKDTACREQSDDYGGRLYPFYMYSGLIVAEKENHSGEQTEIAHQEDGGDKLFILGGHRGVGKSTFLDQVRLEWKKGEALLDKDVLILWNFKKFNANAIRSLDEMLDVLPIFKRHVTAAWEDVIGKIRSSHGKNLLVIVDHFVQPGDFLSSLLRQEVLWGCSIVVATQYSHIGTLNETLMGRNHEFLHIKGVKRENVHELLTTKGQQQKIKSVDRIADFIRVNSNLKGTFRNPTLAQELIDNFKDNRFQYPKTETDLINGVIKRMLKKLDLEPSELEDHLYAICSFAFQSLKHGNFDRYEFSCMYTHQGIPGAMTKIGLGLMDILVYGGRISCKFIHETIQAYLVARYLHKMPLFELAQVLLDIVTKAMSNNTYRMTLVYFCGIAHSLAMQTSSFNVIKIALHPLLESMADRLLLEEDCDPDSEKILFFLTCLHEAQDPNLTKNFLSRRQHLLKIPLKSDQMLAESGLLMLSYCLAHSGVDEWKIETISKKRYLMDYLTMLVMDQLSPDTKSQFKVQIIEGSLIQLSPVNPKVSTPTKSKSNIFCRIIREILHRLLQLYSPIKLKSDGSNVSYVSILACKCLQDQMEARNLLTLEPIAAAHWLLVKQKEKKSATQSDANPQTLFHMQQHGNQHIEFVLMTSPYPDRIKFIMPGTRDEIVIELSTNNSPNFNLTGIEDHLDLNRTRSHVFHHETHFDTNHAKLILPSLPLPDQTHSKSVTLAPEVSEPHRTPMQRQRSFENLEAITAPRPDSLQQSTVDSINKCYNS